MKKVFLFTAVLALMVGAMAQSDTLQNRKMKTNPSQTDEKPVVVRDRLVFDIFHTFWMGTPSQGEFMKFDPGFNVSAMWDFKLPQTKAITFGLGLGFTYYTQYSNCLLRYNRGEDVTKYYLLPESIEYKRSKMAYMNVNIPFEIRYRHRSGFKLGVGVHVGLVAGLSHRYKGPDYNGVEGATLNYKDKDFYNKQKFSADVYLRMGWKSFGVYYSYQINKIFETDKGPKMTPMSVGISIALF